MKKVLLEAAYDRYLSMFNPIVNKVIEPVQNSDVANPEVSKELEEIKNTVIPSLTRWAITTLKKQDKITWFLRLSRIAVLKKIYIITEKLDERGLLTEFAKRIYVKERSNWLTTLDIPEQNHIASIDSIIHSGIIQKVEGFRGPSYISPTGFYIQHLTHFFTQNIPTIQEMTFPPDMAPTVLNIRLSQLENDWKEKQARYIDFETQKMESEPEVLIQYENGAQWLNLNKPVCDLEARAMGHCGNSGSVDADETILSFRTVEKHPQKKTKVWVPHLTFILDDEGYLGEMKGRNNQKPDQKYHGVIYDLLKLPIIKGIKGGGYLPENNFRLLDFPKEVANNLMDEKPELATLEHLYKKEGVTEELIAKMKSVVTRVAGNRMEPFYDAKRDMFLFFKFNYQMFWSQRFNNVALLMNALQNKGIAGSMGPSRDQVSVFITILPPSALKALYTAASLHLGDWESIVQFIGPKPDVEKLVWFFETSPLSRGIVSFINDSIEMLFVDFASDESVQKAFETVFLKWINNPTTTNTYDARFFRTSKDNFSEVRLAVPSERAVELVTKLDGNDTLPVLDSWFDELSLVDVSFIDILDAIPKNDLKDIVERFERGVEVYNNQKRKDKRVL